MEALAGGLGHFLKAKKTGTSLCRQKT